jgi:tetratricopeptide (TPR) repeat protein
MRHNAAAVLFTLFAAFPASGAAQIPEKFENLQHFPKDISRDALVQQMREFSFALNVRCQYCHAGGDGISFEGVSFKSDEKVAKQKARFMLKMVDELNGRTLAGVPSRRTPPVKMTCVTCHRGSAVPRTLGDVLAQTIADEGPDAAVKQYRQLRENMHNGRFDFGEWSMNELAVRLGHEGNRAAAIAMLKLNGEFYPKSADIDIRLGDQYAASGQRDLAIASFKSALEKQPDNPRAKQRLAELSK